MRFVVIVSLLAGLISACAPKDSQNKTSENTISRSVNIFSARHYDSDDAIYVAFYEQTGIEINRIEASGDLLIERVRADGERSPADILITVDAGRLWRAEQAGLFQSASELDDILSTLPANVVHPEKAWFGFSTRVRGLAYSTERVNPNEITDFTDLADPVWSGRICVRSSDNVYNQSLLAALIEAVGAEEAERWAAAVRSNMAREPQGGDTDQIRAIAAGECDVAIVNHYYAIRLERSESETDQNVATAVDFKITPLAGRGAHMNISGAGLAAGAPNRSEAIEFLQFLLSQNAQKTFPELTNEYPIFADTPYDNPELKALGDIQADPINVNTLGQNATEAQRIFDRVRWP